MPQSLPFNSAALMTVIGNVAGDQKEFEDRYTRRFTQDAKTFKLVVQWLESFQTALYEILGLPKISLQDELALEMMGRKSVHVSAHLMISRLLFSAIELTETGCIDPVESEDELARKAIVNMVKGLRKKLDGQLPPDLQEKLDRLDEQANETDLNGGSYDFPPLDLPPLDFDDDIDPDLDLD